jgi:hypothetical protein
VAAGGGGDYRHYRVTAAMCGWVVAMTGWAVGPYFQGSGRDVRIGTTEREQAVQLLAEHLSAGRLEVAEFEERVSAAYAARTAAQLAALFRDLPGPLPSMPGYRMPRAVPRRAIMLVLVIVLLGVLVADVAFPPLFFIPIVFLVLRARRRWRCAYAGDRRAYAGDRRAYAGSRHR